MSSCYSDSVRQDFPILCETCLGDNPYVRMIRAHNDKECKICVRPFTVYKWKAGTDGRFKKTEICPTCSKFKHVCQTCLLDIDTGVPVQFRDSILSSTTTEVVGNALTTRPKSKVMQEYQASVNESQISQGFVPDYSLANHAVQMEFPHTEPYYKRNRSKVCSFWIKGTCNRGASCPFRHEKPDHLSPELASQNIKDRYYGTEDPVAKKMITRLKEQMKINEVTPDVTTVWVSGVVADHVTESDLRDHFYVFGEIISIKIVESQKCAFIEYARHEEASKAIEHLRNNLVIKGQFLRVNWTRNQSSSGQHGLSSSQRREQSNNPTLYAPPPPGYYFGAPPMLATPANTLPSGLPPASGKMGWAPLYYPSMSPNRLGAHLDPQPPLRGFQSNPPSNKYAQSGGTASEHSSKECDSPILPEHQGGGVRRVSETDISGNDTDKSIFEKKCKMVESFVEDNS